MLIYIIYSSMLVKKEKKRNEMFGYCHIFRDIFSLLSTIDLAIDPLLMQQASIFEFQMNLPDSVSSSPPTIVTNGRLGTK